MRRLACSLALVLSCRANDPVSPPRSVDPPVVAATPTAEPPTEPAPRPLDVLQPVATPWPANAIHVGEVEDDWLVALFPDERAALRREIAAWLEAHGETIVPIAELERLEARGAVAELALESDRKCRVPLRPDDVHRRWFAGRPHASIEAECGTDQGCRLQVSIESPGNEIRDFVSTRVRRPEDPKAWLAAVHSLHETELEGYLGLSGRGGPSPPIILDAPEGVGRWAKPVDHDLYTAKETEAAACAHPDPSVGLVWQLRVAVDRRGRVSRCHAESDSTLARQTDAQCLCDVIGSIGFPPGGSGRRVRSTATDDGQTHSSDARFVLVQPGTEPWIEQLDQSPILRRCVVATALRLPITFPAELALADDGTITDVTIRGDVTDIGRMRFATCVVDELKAFALPCAPPGISTLHAQIVLGG